MLTGFDAPPLHTLYLDRPLKGALLMQTLARVNRTFRGKQDGLLVAYAPLADNLSKALAEYTATDQAEQAGRARRRRGRRLIAGRARRQIRRDARRLRLARTGLPGGPSAGVNGGDRADQLPALAGNAGQRSRLEGETATRRRGYRTAAEPAGARVGAVRPVGQTSPNCAPRSRSTKKCGSGWRSSTPPERQARGEPIPEEIQRPARALVADVDRARRGPRHLRGRGHAAAVASMTSARSSSRKAQAAPNPHLAIEALRDAHRRGVRQGDPGQPRAPAGVLRAHRRADEPVHEPAAHLRRGDRRAGRAGARRSPPRQPRRALLAAARRRTSSRSTTRSRRTSRPSTSRARTCSRRSRASWSP